MKYIDDSHLPEITEAAFRATLATSRHFTVLILRAGPNFKMPGLERDPALTALIAQHGKRNISLRAAGLMPIVCPVADGSGVTGIGVFDASPEDVERIYAADPAVKAGVFTYEIHASRSFPGSVLARSGDDVSSSISDR